MQRKLTAIVGCETSGVVRSRLRAKGWDAWSCDILPADDGSEFHYQGDILEVLDRHQFDLGIFHPPCTYLCSSGLHWNHKVPGRAEKTEEALEFVCKLLNANIPRIALENPVGCISTRITPYTQRVNPYEFGHDVSKGTCLWLKNLPPLLGTCYVQPKHLCPECGHRFGWNYEACPECRTPATQAKRWGNQTPAGQDGTPPSADRWKLRSKTFEGIGDAIASQWTNLPELSPEILRAHRGSYTVKAKSPAAE